MLGAWPEEVVFPAGEFYSPVLANPVEGNTIGQGSPPPQQEAPETPPSTCESVALRS